MMRRLIVAALLPLAACSGAPTHDTITAGNAQTDNGQNSAGTRTFAARDFSKITLRGSTDVRVVTGGDFSITATGDAEILDRIEIGVDGDMLTIAQKPGGDWRWKSHRPTIVTVTMPRITAATLDGSGDLAIDKVSGDFSGNIAGSGDLSVKTVQAEDATFAVMGSGDLTAAGSAASLTIDISGSGDIDAGKVVASRATVRATGSGDVNATIRGPATVELTGSGDVNLGKDATCTVSKSGSGDVSCG